MYQFGQICKESRQKSGFTKESAVSVLYISDSSLGRYESGEIVPSAVTVMNMRRHYNDPFLVLYYCRSCCPIGSVYSFVVDKNIDFATAALKYADAERVAHEDIAEFINVSAEPYKLHQITKEDKLYRIVRNLLKLEHTIQMIKVALDTIGIDIKGLIKEYNEEYCSTKKKTLLDSSRYYKGFNL